MRRHPPPKRIKITRKDVTYGKGYNPKTIPRNIPINADRKFFDFSAESTNMQVGGAGQPTNLQYESFNLITQGTAQNQRIGTHILVRNITVRGACGIDVQSNATPGSLNLQNNFRVILYIDTQANGALTSISSIFDTTLSTGDEFDVYNNMTTKGRYKILMDKWINVTAQSLDLLATDTTYRVTESRVRFKKTIPLNLPITFSNDTDAPTIADVFTNNIGMFVLSDREGATNALQGFVDIRTRLRFVDM